MDRTRFPTRSPSARTATVPATIPIGAPNSQQSSTDSARDCFANPRFMSSQQPTSASAGSSASDQMGAKTAVEMEFVTVQAVLDTGAATRAVDAFALSLIKHERQLRRLLTYSVFQFPVFGSSDIVPLRGTLAANERIFAEGFIRGLDALWPVSVANLVGARHAELSKSLTQAVGARNKIFHGQVTELGLDREALLKLVADLREWCALLANAAEGAYGYDGFGRDSYRKSSDADLHKRFRVQIKSVTDYAGFLDANVARPRKPKKK